MKYALRIFILTLVLALLVTGCAAPAASSDTSELEAQIADLEAQLEAAPDEETLSDLEAQIADLQAQLDAAAEEAVEEMAAEEEAAGPAEINLWTYYGDTGPAAACVDAAAETTTLHRISMF
jgi:cell division protein FtsB